MRSAGCLALPPPVRCVCTVGLTSCVAPRGRPRPQRTLQSSLPASVPARPHRLACCVAQHRTTSRAFETFCMNTRVLVFRVRCDEITSRQFRNALSQASKALLVH